MTGLTCENAFCIEKGNEQKNKGQRFEPLPFCLVPLRGAG